MVVEKDMSKRDLIHESTRLTTVQTELID